MKNIKKMGHVAGVASLAMLCLFLGQCFGSSSTSSNSTTSTDETSTADVTLTTTVTAPSAVSSSVSALVKGGSRFAVTDEAVTDTEIVVYNLTTQPETPTTGSDGEDLGESAIAIATTDSEGNCDIGIDADDVNDGDQLLIEAGDITQIVEYEAPAEGTTEIELPATDLASTLAVQSWRTMLSNAGVDVTDLRTINLGDSAITDLIPFDTHCFMEYNRQVFSADETDSGLAGQIGTTRNAFAQAYLSGNFESTMEEYVAGGGTLSEETLLEMSEGTATALGMDTETVATLAQTGLNGMSSLSQILTSTIATDDEDSTTENFCDQVRADTSGDFISNAVQTMVFGMDDIADFAASFGTTENVSGFMEVIENYRDESVGTWNFDNFQPHAMAGIFTNFIDSGNVEFDPDMVYSMMSYVPTSTDGSDYNPDFYRDWGTAMFATYEDTSASNFTNFDPATASVYYSAQLLGGGLVIDDSDLNSTNFASAGGYGGFYTSFSSSGSVGGVDFNDCLTDATSCQTMFNAGGSYFEASSTGFEYDDTLAEIYTATPDGLATNCGNGTCDASTGESPRNCFIDCFDPDTAETNGCGNGTCDDGESAYCFIDCQSEFTETFGGAYGGSIVTEGTFTGSDSSTSGGTTSGSTTSGGTTSGGTTSGGTTSGSTTSGGTTSGSTTSGSTTSGGTTSGSTTSGGTTSGSTTSGGTTSGSGF